MACPGGGTVPGPSAGALHHDEDPRCRQDAPDSSTDVWQAENSSPESCSICLGPVKNRSFTDSCFHTFCFVCLLEWAKVRAVCPLCKQPFQSIIHNVRSIQDYDQYHLRPEENGSFEAPDGRRFRYSTTMTHDRWMMAVQRDQERQLRLLQRPSRMLPSIRDEPSGATSNFRNHIYMQRLRVRHVSSGQRQPPRYRDVRPEFLRSNPALLHRLVPWLNRELNVLLYHHREQVQFLLELIMDLVQRFSIQSDEFAEHIRPYMGTRTAHFQHEFLHFARSPYDMVEYDRHAVYDGEAPVHQVGSSSSSEDDVIMLSPGGIPLPFPPPQQPPAVRQGAPQETPTPMYPGMNSVMESDTARSGWESPTPGPSNLTYPSPPQPSGQGTASTPPIEEITLSSTPDHDSPVQIPSSNQPSITTPADEANATHNYVSRVTVACDNSGEAPDGNQPRSVSTGPVDSHNMTDIPSSQLAADSTEQTGESETAISEPSAAAICNPEPPADSSNAAEEESDEDDLIIVSTEKAWEERSPIPLSSASDSEPEPEPESKASKRSGRTSRTPSPTYADRAYLWDCVNNQSQSPRRKDRDKQKRRHYSSESSHSSLSSRRDEHRKKNYKRSRYRSRSVSSDRFRSSRNKKHARRECSSSYSRRSRSTSRSRRRRHSRSWSRSDRRRQREEPSRQRRSRSNSYRRSPESSRHRRRDRSPSNSRARTRHCRSRSDSWDQNRRNRYQSQSPSRRRRRRSRSGSRHIYERSASRRRSRSTSYSKRHNKKSRREKSPKRKQAPDRPKDKNKAKKRKRAPVSQWTPFIIKVEKPDDYAPEGGTRLNKKDLAAAKSSKTKTLDAAKSKSADHRSKSTNEASSKTADSSSKPKLNDKSKSHESKSRSTTESVSKSGEIRASKSKSGGSSGARPSVQSGSHGQQASSTSTSAAAGNTSKPSSQRPQADSDVAASGSGRRKSNSGTVSSSLERQKSNKETGKSTNDIRPEIFASYQRRSTQSDKQASNRQRTISQSDETSSDRPKVNIQSGKSDSNQLGHVSQFGNSTSARKRNNSQPGSSDQSRLRTNPQSEKPTSNRQRTNSEKEKSTSHQGKSISQTASDHPGKSKAMSSKGSNQPQNSSNKRDRTHASESEKALSDRSQARIENKNSQRPGQGNENPGSQSNKNRNDHVTEKCGYDNSVRSTASGKTSDRTSAAEPRNSVEARPVSKHGNNLSSKSMAKSRENCGHDEAGASRDQSASHTQVSGAPDSKPALPNKPGHRARQASTGSSSINKTKPSQTSANASESGSRQSVDNASCKQNTTKRACVTDGLAMGKVSDSQKSHDKSSMKSSSSSVSKKTSATAIDVHKKKSIAHNQSETKASDIRARKPSNSQKTVSSKPRTRTVSDDGACDRGGNTPGKPAPRQRNRSESGAAVPLPGVHSTGQGSIAPRSIVPRSRTSSDGSSQAMDGANSRKIPTSCSQQKQKSGNRDKTQEVTTRPRSKSGPSDGSTTKEAGQVQDQRRHSEGSKHATDSSNQPNQSSQSKVVRSGVTSAQSKVVRSGVTSAQSKVVRSGVASTQSKVVRSGVASTTPMHTKRLRQMQSLLMARDINKPALYDDLDLGQNVDTSSGDMGGPGHTAHSSLDLPCSPEAANKPVRQPCQVTPPVAAQNPAQLP